MAEIEGFEKSYLLILLLKISFLLDFEILLSSSLERYGHFGHSVNFKFWRQFPAKNLKIRKSKNIRLWGTLTCVLWPSFKNIGIKMEKLNERCRFQWLFCPAWEKAENYDSSIKNNVLMYIKKVSDSSVAASIYSWWFHLFLQESSPNNTL
jgi:hypothetical protein